MAFDPSIEEQEFLADTIRLTSSGMAPPERAMELLVAAGFLLLTAALWLHQPPPAFPITSGVLCWVLMVLATLVRFDTPFGFTVATQLAFVPLLFALPLAVVPVAVVTALLAAQIPAVVQRKIRPSRMLLAVGNSWFALGPVAVFVLAGTSPRNAGPELLIAALVAQFAVDFGISALRLWVAREASIKAQFRESWVYLIDAGLSGIGLVVAQQMVRAPAAGLALLPLLALLSTFAKERRGRLERLLELNDAYRGTALVLGDVVEADDGYTGKHCRGVVALALEVGETLDLSGEQRRNLEFGSLLHDVGKVAIPKEIINKPGKLDAREWTIIKTHTTEGQRMLDQVGGFMRDVGLIVRSHHERWDGGGYPDGLAAEEIPLEARIIACCDTWSAMRTNRAYRRALSEEVALAELRATAGTQLDPRVVDALVQIIEANPAEIPPATVSPKPPASHDRPREGFFGSVTI